MEKNQHSMVWDVSVILNDNETRYASIYHSFSTNADVELKCFTDRVTNVPKVDMSTLRFKHSNIEPS